MLTPYRPQFIEKILTDAYGREFRVTFAVSFVDGEVRGRIISAQPLHDGSGLALKGVRAERKTSVASTMPCLPVFFSNKASDTAYVPAYASTISHYFSLEFLINSQPTRAPAFV
jgi:hypothetical protein